MAWIHVAQGWLSAKGGPIFVGRLSIAECVICGLGPVCMPSLYPMEPNQSRLAILFHYGMLGGVSAARTYASMSGKGRLSPWPRRSAHVEQPPVPKLQRRASPDRAEKAT